MKDKILNIVPMDGCKNALLSAGILEENIFVLDLLLSFGDLSDLNIKTRNSVKKLYPKEDINVNFSKEYDELLSKVSQFDSIRVWSGHLFCDGYCLLLYICKLFPNKKIRVLFSEEISWNAILPSMLNEKEIPLLLDREHILNNDEVENYIHTWDEVQKQNSDLRFVVNGVIKNVSIDYFDNIILNRLKTKGEIYFYTLVASFIMDELYNQYCDCIYIYLINRLIDLKKIKIAKEVKGKKYIKIVK